TVQVVASANTWALTDASVIVDPFQGDPLLQRGNLTVMHALDLDKSPGTWRANDPALVYSSERVQPKPIIQAQLPSDSSSSLPANITVTLTWNGTAQASSSFSTSGRSAGEVFTLAQQVSTAVTTSGRYAWTLDVSFNNGSPISRSVSGVAYVIVED